MTISLSQNNQFRKIILPGIAASCFLLVSLLSFKRSYFGFGTETDYLGAFVPEAQRVIAGEPLLLEFHPPLYSMCLALVQTLMQDWLRTGLLVSLAASAVALVTNFLFFYRLLGVYAGWGAILGLITSSVFLKYSAYATSDIFFLALYSTAFLLSLLAVKQKFAHLWILSGLAVGCILLTRTNGITCLLIAVLPWWSGSSFRQKQNNFLYFLLGLLIPLLSWVAYALFSGSQLTPAGTYANFALTYFSPSDRISGDARVQVEAQFDSLVDVLAYDPIHLARIYFADLISLGQSVAKMLPRPLGLFVPIGIFSFFKGKTENGKICIFYIALTLLQVLLVNFKAYEDRYFLFLLPVLGVIVSKAFEYLISLVRRQKSRRVVAVFCMICVLLSLALSFRAAWRAVDSSVGELAEAVPKVQQLMLSGASMIARKPHIPFYTGSTLLSFPAVETLPELRCALKTQLTSGDLFLYYGTQEKAFRRQFEVLSDPEASPDWLKPVEYSAKSDSWVLYKYDPNAPWSVSQSCKAQL